MASPLCSSDESGSLCSGQKCHPQARCLAFQNKLNQRCVCNNGYEGDGVTCTGENAFLSNLFALNLTEPKL